uniref:RING-type domain-containing protein n=3 Tax=Solanum lycopersicum TaxID=4081 RepID=A0A3Q7GDR5_SOLLC
MRYLTRNSGFLASVDEDDQHSGICSLQDIGGHVMKIPLICFQILLFMRLAGTPPSAAFIPIPVLFIPLFLLQGAGLLFSVYRLVETVILLVDGERGVRSYFRMSSVIRDSFSCMRHGSRLLGWWSIDEDSREEQARLYYAETETSGYNTFSPDTVKQMPKAKLTEEIWRLQAALCEQSDFTQSKQEEFERLQNEKILCRICFEEHINILLLPCRHHILCSTCCDKCKRCPICRMFIEERLLVNDV